METSLSPELLQLRQKVSECLAGGGKVAVVGIGSELHRDDIAGVLIARGVNDLAIPNVQGFMGCTAPENITGEIVQYRPALTVFVDAAELGLNPGELRLVPRSEIGGITFSTHTLPLALIMDYLKQATQSEFLVLAVQPASVEFGSQVHPAVLAAVKGAVTVLID